MSINEYLSGNAKAKAQEVLDSFEKSLTIIIGTISIGPIALFIISTLTSPYLSLLTPIFIATAVLIIKRLFLTLKVKLNYELLKSMKVYDDFINNIISGKGSILVDVLGIEDSRKWFYVLRALNNKGNDLLDSLLSRELEGDLSMTEIGLARYILAIRFASDKLTISMFRRGLRTIMVGYYILLFAIPAVAKSLQLLGVHWNLLFIVLIQVLILMVLLLSLRIFKRELGIEINISMFLLLVL
ncbi:MAG: hypothetical protein TU36_007225 [Vulcanisaeta sp. AZ3]|jgi:hypothetical protein